AVPPAVLLREGEPVVAGGVGPPPHLGQQRLPLLAGQAAAIPVGPGVLAAMVEEALVVVLGLAGLDLALDEVVELVEVGGDVGGDLEVHGVPPPKLPRSGPAPGRQRSNVGRSVGVVGWIGWVLGAGRVRGVTGRV